MEVIAVEVVKLETHVAMLALIFATAIIVDQFAVKEVL